MLEILSGRRFDAELVASLTHEYLHISPIAVTPCYKGMYNSVWFIETDVGQIILKVAPDPNIPCMTSEHNMLAAEVDALLRMKSRGIPLPELLAFDECEKPRFFFMSYIEGERFCELTERLDCTDIASLRCEIGRLTREIHTLKGDYFGFVGNPALRADSWKQLMLMLFGAQLADGSRVGFSLPFAACDDIRALVYKYADVFDDVAEPCLTHGDLWDGNVLVSRAANGWQISGIIDWERACFADGLMENGFANYDRPDPDFLSGYGKTTFTQSELIRCSLYRLSLYLGMSIGHVYRNGANTQPEWMLEAFREELAWLMEQ